MTPFLKFYFTKNHRFGTEIQEFIPPTKEDFELLLGHGMGHGRFTDHDDYVVEMRKRHHESEKGIIGTEMLLASIAIGSEERLKELEENGPEDPDFIKWVEN